MTRNHLIKFANWYENKANKSSNYLTNQFKGDKELFLSSLIDYATEYAIAFKHNPFSIEENNFDKLIEKIKNNLYSKGNKTSFSIYSSNINNHMPRAILGKENYLKYLQAINKSENLNEGDSIRVKPKQHSKSYTKDDLVKNFTFRLITQDRFYSFLYFPISVLKKFFYNLSSSDAKFFDEWVSNQINSIQFTTENETIYFNDILELEFRNGKVLLTAYHGEEYVLHTKIAGSDSSREIEVQDLDKLSIDHITPFKKVLKDLKDCLPVLNQIHSKLIELNDGYEISGRKCLSVPGNIFIDTVKIDGKALDSLKKELNLISSKLQLQILDKKENLSKKKFD